MTRAGLRLRVVDSGCLLSGAHVFQYFKNWYRYGWTHVYRYGWALPRMEKMKPCPWVLRVLANESFLTLQETQPQVPLPVHLHTEPDNGF